VIRIRIVIIIIIVPRVIKKTSDSRFLVKSALAKVCSLCCPSVLCLYETPCIKVLVLASVTQDGRLRQNDRLVRLNGVSLIGHSNSQTMSTLREALQRRGTVAGYIDLVVARRSSFQPTLTHCCSSDALADTPPTTMERPISDSHSDKTSRKSTTHGAAAATKTTKGVSRNMSYQLANGDSFVSDSSRLSTPRTGAVVTKSMKAPTINGGHGDTVLIETEESRPSNVSSAFICFKNIYNYFIFISPNRKQGKISQTRIKRSIITELFCCFVNIVRYFFA